MKVIILFIYCGFMAVSLNAQERKHLLTLAPSLNIPFGKNFSDNKIGGGVTLAYSVTVGESSAIGLSIGGDAFPAKLDEKWITGFSFTPTYGRSFSAESMWGWGIGIGPGVLLYNGNKSAWGIAGGASINKAFLINNRPFAAGAGINLYHVNGNAYPFLSFSIIPCIVCLNPN